MGIKASLTIGRIFNTRSLIAILLHSRHSKTFTSVESERFVENQALTAKTQKERNINIHFCSTLNKTEHVDKAFYNNRRLP